MTTVRVVKNWNFPNLMRQTPSQAGIWNGIKFTEGNQQECDFLIVLNRLVEPVTVTVPPRNIWHLTQEPPVQETAYSRPESSYFYRYFTQTNQKGDKYIHTHTALPWHVNKSYDELKSLSAETKDHKLSWITSNQKYMKGHKKRMAFLESLQSNIQFDLWGRGFTPISDKWDGLAPYRYALAIENYSGLDYWSEKLADCFLAWTMPIYYGATNIASYFPPESMILIDIEKPYEAIKIIKEAIESDLYLRNREAIAHARHLILEKYQFFPFISNYIETFTDNLTFAQAKNITIPASIDPHQTSWITDSMKRFAKKARAKVRKIYGR